MTGFSFRKATVGGLKGLTFGKYFSPFYDTARRFVGMSPYDLDRFLEAGDRALMDNLTIQILHADGGVSVYSVRRWHRTRGNKWVTEFNRRSATPKDPS